MEYPELARRSGIEGRVYVKFVLNKDGIPIEVKTIMGIGGHCDEKAELVVKRYKKWNPGIKRGQPVESKLILPITFKLN
ncbi:MAG: energy transducer TonB [Reichenbachiella sp.]